MTDSSQLCSAIVQKIRQQVDRVQHLILLIPPDRLDWRPTAGAVDIAELLGHLLECLAGFCAVLSAAKPDALAHFSELKKLKVNHRCGLGEAGVRIGEYAKNIGQGFAALTDDDLVRLIPTVFSTEGETVLGLVLNNLEHLASHKYQLFFYLKLVGVEVTTTDLYCTSADRE